MGKTINIGLLGLGTVGSGTARILLEQPELLEQRIGTSIRLARICDLDITTSRGFPVPSEILTDDIRLLLDDPEQRDMALSWDLRPVWAAEYLLLRQ